MVIKSVLARYVFSNKSILWPLIKRSKKYRNIQISDKSQFVGCNIIDNGSNNRIIIEDGAKAAFCTISFQGNNNVVTIKKNAQANSVTFYTAGNDNEIFVGENTTFTGRAELIAVEGTKISIGQDNMFAYGIVLRTGDHHTIFDAEGTRVNKSKDIVLGDHVWIGQNAYILKGVELADNSIVGACATVTRGSAEKGSVFAGNPARIIKTNANWDREML